MSLCDLVLVLCVLFSIQAVGAFTAYDCSQPEVVKHYDLLSAGDCATEPNDRLVERSIYGEVVQVKEMMHIEAYSCYAVVTTSQQHCGMWSHAGIQRHKNFRQVVNIEPQACRNAQKTKMITLEGRTFNVTNNVRNYFNVISAGLFDEETLKCYGDSNGLVIQNDYEVYFGYRSVQVHTVTQIITIPTVGGPLQARVHDEGVMDSEFGTFVWSVPDLACPDSIISLYRGQVVLKTNSSRTPVFRGGIVIIDIQEDTNESQVGHGCFHTLKKNLVN